VGRSGGQAAGRATALGLADASGLRVSCGVCIKASPTISDTKRVLLLHIAAGSYLRRFIYVGLHTGFPPVLHLRASTEFAERLTQLGYEESRLLECRKMTTLGDFIPVEELGIDLFGPRLQRAVQLSWEDAYSHREV